MEITFNLSELYAAMDSGQTAVAWYFFKNGGWIIYFIVISRGIFEVWHLRQSIKWFDTNKFVILAIDVPKDTEQTPKAVEQLFSTVSGAHGPLNLLEIYRDGQFQLGFSFEIVSIDGYVQFLIRTPTQFRDLIESSIYSQYPDAEITEVEDYIDTTPNDYPNDTHNIWGTEVVLAENEAYPIRTYTEFEDAVSGEFKDPLASMLETMSKIQIGEQVWFQIIVKPTGFSWPKRSMKQAYKIAGKKFTEKKGFFNRVFDPITSLFFLSTGEPMIWPQDLTASPANKTKDDMPSLMLHLTPGEKAAIEAIENKASKTGFECKIRLIYISPKELYAPARVISSVFGSIKQFNTMDLNSFMPDKKTKTKINYFFIKTRTAWRRKRLMTAYKKRSGTRGHNYFILNTEELATIWHFPSKFVKAPLLQRTETKKSEPPSSLPIHKLEASGKSEVSEELTRQLVTPNFNVDLSDKHFEEKFAKKDTKTAEAPRHKGQAPPNLPTS
ncbi:MAG: hypothetical protein HOC78_00485 [Candidatus Komeilibacteria bacterium]|jgi:hypothetical protein|nr:hypothetical protein [Candidatus Komeilibacteria bacterium]